MTEYKTIRFTFPVPLSYTQEDTFIASIQHITKQVKSKLQNIQKIYTAASFLKNQQTQTILSTVNHILKDFDSYLILEKEGQRIYVFKMATSFEALKMWGAFRRLYMKFFYGQVVPQLKIRKEEIVIQFSD